MQSLHLWGAGTLRSLRPLWVAEELGLKYPLPATGPRTDETQPPKFSRLKLKQKNTLATAGHVFVVLKCC